LVEFVFVCLNPNFKQQDLEQTDRTNVAGRSVYGMLVVSTVGQMTHLLCPESSYLTIPQTSLWMSSEYLRFVYTRNETIAFPI
jgi:hypothetical protein